MNIYAGAKYLRLLVEKYSNNAAPGNLAKSRRLVRQQGLNPNIWVDNVENAATEVVGRQTVLYVCNICKYYLAYQMVIKREQAAVKGKTAAPKDERKVRLKLRGVCAVCFSLRSTLTMRLRSDVRRRLVPARGALWGAARGNTLWLLAFVKHER